jgi:hypothetical protein
MIIYHKYGLNEIFPTKREYSVELTKDKAILMKGPKKYIIDTSSSDIYENLMKRMREKLYKIPMKDYYGDILYIDDNNKIWMKTNEKNESKINQDIYSEETYYFDHIMSILFKNYL